MQAGIKRDIISAPSLNASEMTELDEYLRIDNVMSLLKAQVFRSLPASS
jgi:hypothetical protein